MPFQTGLTERAQREWLRSGSSRFNERVDTLRRAQDPFHQLRNLDTNIKRRAVKATKPSRGLASDVDLLTDDGTQIAPLNYPHLGHTEIFDSVEDFYKKFYFRPSKIMEIVKEMLTSRDMLVRRLREGVEFFQFLKNREDMIVS